MPTYNLSDRKYLNSSYLLGLLLLITLSAYFFDRQRSEPPCCDADHYLLLAKSYISEGMFSVKQELRTYGYPLILAVVLTIGGVLNIPEHTSIYLFQLTLYCFSIYCISWHLHSYSPLLGKLVFLGLSLNILVIPYVGITLTDSVYVSVCTLVFLLLVAIQDGEFLQYYNNRRLKTRLATLGALVGLAIVVRPAAIWLLIPLVPLLITLVSIRKWRATLPIIYLSIGLGIPLAVQIFINIKHFGVFTFLPPVDLGQMQIKWGIENFKYGTWLGGGAPQMFYSSASLTADSSGSYDIWWYFRNFTIAVKLVILKLIGAFDFDFIMPYPYHRPNAFDYAMAMLSLSIFYLGIFAIGFHAWTKKLRGVGSRFFPLITFGAWCVVTLSSALELRFTLPMLIIFVVFSCSLIVEIYAENNRRMFGYILAGYGCAMPFIIYGASVVRSHNVIYMN